VDSIQGIYEIRRERILEYMRLAQDKYKWAVRPIYGRVRPGIAPKHIGSCVLLLVSDTRFLVTAGHITDVSKHTTLHVTGNNELIPLSFDSGVTTNPEVPRDKDVHDFSVCALSDATRKELGDVKYITEKEMHKALPLGHNRLRMVMGFPTSKNRKGVDNLQRRIGGTGWTYVSFATDDTHVATNLGIRPGDHVFVEFDHKESINPDGVGTHSMAPAGASGGAMFDLGKLDDPERLAKPAKCEAKLVGILTEYRARNKTIVATRIKLVLDACQHLLSMRAVSEVKPSRLNFGINILWFLLYLGFRFLPHKPYSGKGL